MQIDLLVLELLASKLCHDLVSPVSAINNGVELIEDIGGSVVDEAMKLIGDSAQHASRRLRLYRMAYGRAGSEDNLGIKDVRQLAEQYLAGGKSTITWPENQPPEIFGTHKGTLKVMLNLIVLAEELLPYGGNIALGPAHEDGCMFTITGRSAQLTPPLHAALENVTPVEELTPRSVQAYITGRFAAHFGVKLTPTQHGVDRLEMIVTLIPGAAASVPTPAAPPAAESAA